MNPAALLFDLFFLFKQILYYLCGLQMLVCIGYKYILYKYGYIWQRFGSRVAGHCGRQAGTTLHWSQPALQCRTPTLGASPKLYLRTGSKRRGAKGQGQGSAKGTTDATESKQNVLPQNFINLLSLFLKITSFIMTVIDKR